MAIIETLVLETGPAIAKAILKMWLKDAGIAADTASAFVDILRSKTKDIVAQQRAKRQFEEIGEKVAESLLPLFQIEGKSLDDAGRSAVALAVAQTLNDAPITPEFLLKRDLEPTELAKHFEHFAPDSNRFFSEAEAALHKRIIAECSQYIVDIASQLPSFTERTFSEILKRQNKLLATTEDVLNEVRNIYESLRQGIPDAELAYFEAEYRRSVRRTLDNVVLPGVDVAEPSRRQRLSVAYIALSVKRESGFTSAQIDDGSKDFQSRSIVSVSEMLAKSNRILVQGQAGSGKTTLLKWIAVQSALQRFDKELADWNNTVPFFIRLRECAESRLPAPEEFPRLVAPSIAATMPDTWVHRQFRLGRAIVLVDGVDEVPMARRHAVRDWLEELIQAYPDVRFVVTSRPPAVTDQLWATWLQRQNFEKSELQPMDLPSLYAFIEHWHSAVSKELQDDEQKVELTLLENHLKETIQTNRAMRNIAANPLLCAMICALHRERRTHVPSDRIELYRACNRMLLTRREKERGIELADYPQLSYREQCTLLQDLAYWLLLNGWSEVSMERAEARIARKLQSMPNLRRSVIAKEVLRLFVDRSGVVIAPAIDVMSFAHRTFQEFFAAQAVLDEGDIGLLIKNAHDDQWREVVILAAGLASMNIRSEITRELIARGDDERELRHQLHLLAVACLEVSTDLKPSVWEKVERCLEMLVPPKDITEAMALASAGELVLPHLSQYIEQPASVTAACVRTLALIGGERALYALRSYAIDKREEVVDELVRGWDSFDRYDYARHVLAVGEHSDLSLSTSSLEGIEHLTTIRRLDLSRCRRLYDLEPLTALPSLTELNLSAVDLTDANLGVLAKLTKLSRLELNGAYLSDADLYYSEHSSLDLSPLTALRNLTFLDLSGIYLVGVDLNPLRQLGSLRQLNLSGADLSGANLRDFNLSSTDLEGACLVNANLRRADLSFAELNNADLCGADLSNANLHGASLENADLRDATLSCADLNSADLTGADLSGADLAGAILDGTDLAAIDYNADTVWPDDIVLHDEEKKAEYWKYLSEFE